MPARGSVTETDQSNETAVKNGQIFHKSLSYSMDHKLLLTTLLEWRRSILPRTLTKLDVWIATFVHTALFVVKHFVKSQTGNPNIFSVVAVPFGAISMSITLMTFSLNFFNNDCYARYKGFYSAAAGMGGTISNISCILATDFAELPLQRQQVLRYIIASACVVYMKVYDSTTDGGGGIEQDEWTRLSVSEAEYFKAPVKVAGIEVDCPPLLTHEEVEILKKYKGSKSLLLQTWAMRLAGEGYGKLGLKPEESPAMGGLGTQFLNLKGHGGYIMNTLALPVPYPYWHMLITIMVVNYGFFCIAFLSYDSYLTPLVMFFVCVILSSFREMSIEMINPFGHDEVDFPVSKYITDLRAGNAPIIKDIPWSPSMDPIITKIEN